MMALQKPSKQFRSLAPKITPGIPASTTSGSNKDTDDVKLKRASMACTECKRRRTKCSFGSGEDICNECALQGRQCIVDEFADKRRKIAAKHAQKDLEQCQKELRALQESTKHAEESKNYYQDFLNKLLQKIQEGDPVAVEAIIDVIQSGASKDQIRKVIFQSSADDAKPTANNI